MCWLSHFGLISRKKEWTHAHVSGHGSGNQMRKVIEGVQAKSLVPIHIEHTLNIIGDGTTTSVKLLRTAYCSLDKRLAISNNIRLTADFHVLFCHDVILQMYIIAQPPVSINNHGD